MRKQMGRRLSALLLAVCMAFPLCAPAAWAAEVAGEIVTIRTVEELLNFAKSCALDTWSQGKTVKLAEDLDLMGAEFTPIPTFGGTFLGQGHTISGLCITRDGSTQGLFRYIQPGAVVQDLTVTGLVAPGGSRSTVGGIAGDNGGTIRNCAFQGTVQGDSAVGGIAGRNSAGGEIIGCTVSGTVSGESAAGGVAGRSLGLIMECKNSAGVNLTQSGDAPLDSALEGLAGGGEDGDGLLGGCFDTGGIVGYSSGVVQSCTNSGAVGYPHVGYNTGGIAGRQDGYLAGCVNTGTINGRKDVGGIVGQGEPDLLVDPSGDSLERLRGELDALDRLIDRALGDARSTTGGVTARLEAMGGFTDSARDSSQGMLDRLASFADGNMETVNTLTADLTGALDKITPALDDLSAVGRRLETMSGQLKRSIDSLIGAANTGDRVMRDLRAAAGRLEAAGAELQKAADALGDALKELAKALPEVKDGGEPGGEAGSESDENQGEPGGGTDQGNGEAARALQDVEESAQWLAAAVSEAAGAAEALQAAVDESGSDAASGGETSGGEDGGETDAGADNGEPEGPDWWPDDVGKPDWLPDDVEKPSIPDFGDFNWDAVDADKVKQDLEAIGGALGPAGDALTEALNRLDQALKDANPISGQLKAALRQMQNAADSAGAIGTLAGRAFDAISGAVKGLTAGGPAQFVTLGDGFHQDSDGLFNALAGLSGEMDGLNRTVQGGSDQLDADLRAINRQFHTVCTVLLDAVSDITGAPETGLETVIEDTSEEDIAATREGKVADCRNSGAVEGDRNVGGVMGAMAIEFDLDPEDDATGIFSFGVTYETKAVLQSCVNQGAVTAKKDCAGGLVGRMDLGTALDCQNYGPVESTGGDYVGGVAGYADASVWGCWAKGTLSGGSYVGGIAGWASRLRDCRAIATITGGSECMGAVAGSVDAEGVLSGNCFVDTGTAGVDGVSYAGRAEPVSFEAISQLEGAPAAFTAFTLTLLADGAVVAQIPFLYGDDLSRITLPAVPERKGRYGVWPEFDVSGTRSDVTVEAEYAPWVTLAPSEEQSGQLSLGFAEGQFTDGAELHVAPSGQTPPKRDVEGAVTWDVSLTGGNVGPGAVLPLRLLSPGGGDADVWQYRNGQWVSVDAQRSGQYLRLTMEGPEGTFYLQPKGDSGWKTALPVMGGGAGVIVLLAVLLRVRKKKKAGTPKAPVGKA